MPQNSERPYHIQTVETEEFSMDYLRFGSGEKTFVIIPGLSVQSVLASAGVIVSMFRPFTEDYTVYLFDRRKIVPAQYPIRDMARDTAGAMRVLGLKDADIYGASQGGMIAMQLAMNDPDLVRRLVLASTAARATKESIRIVDNWIDLAKAGRAQDLYTAFGEAIYPDSVLRRIRGIFSRTAETVTAEELERFVILADSVKGFDVFDSLGTIRCPVMVIGSGDDKLFSEQTFHQLADALPEGRLYMYEGYGHAVYDIAPDFVERMLKFFRDEGLWKREAH